ncbi:UDP-N-acetylmuramoyl-L-alanyl-D-glutamate--2,6-diaminopimelate ligase [Marinilabiliaceae bacterium ANBcel2]|nr:UDP-N-acetylmuramoyl-L-alanyl-D-glutamate--2,6-diaminopimelate ligase [Marinilabiliaceae bacterium ANBcel2]
MKKLSKFLENIEVIERIGEGDPDVTGVTADSRKVTHGSMFVAVEGTQVDGHSYINSAQKQGAVVVLCQNLPEELIDGTIYIKVSDTAFALGVMASCFYDFPSHSINVVGVTGTNGKTTVATLLYQLAIKLGYKAALFSTVANYINEISYEATHTTPNAIVLQRSLKEMVDAGCEFCFMEVSSHAVDQKRISGLNFKGSIFTNITHDHLDYHKTFDAYLAAKKGFFDNLGKDAFALINSDDRNGSIMVQNCKAVKKTYSLRSASDFKTRVIENLFEGMQLEMNGKEVWTPFIGNFNASNLTAVYGAAILLGWDDPQLLPAISTLKPVMGRFDAVRSPHGVTAVVDYAHTPDALQNVLEALNQIRSKGNELITVVGAGGDRDKGKRPLMAAEAVKSSSRVIFTSDNPRGEEPEAIIEDMMKGVRFEDRIKVITIVNRREAIRTACSVAREGDVILIAGKGHETYQEVKGKRSHFDDKEIVQEYFDQL